MTQQQLKTNLSELLTEGDWSAVIERMTTVSMELPLSEVLEPLHLPFEVRDPVVTRIADEHDAAVRAAFAAGLACGLNPALLLLREVQP